MSGGAHLESLEIGEAARSLLCDLADRDFAGVEVYEKRGRSRSWERGADRESFAVAVEAGWAARMGDARRSLFVAATGSPDRSRLLPDPSPHPLLLPEPGPVAPWSEPDDFEAPFATESEGFALLDAIGKGLGGELPGGVLVAARLDEGQSDSFLTSNRGVAVRQRTRAAWLRLEAQGPGDGAAVRRIRLALAARAARAIAPDAVARRLADRLAALRGESDLAREAGEVRRAVLAAPLAARLVEAIAPLLVGKAAPERIGPLLGGDGRLGSEVVTLVDDGRLAGGLLAAGADGEGVPTRRVVLVEAGRFRSPLLAWWEAPRASDREAQSGCARRASWRDLPRRAPTHFYLAAGDVAARDLVAGLEDGVYLIDAEGSVVLDPASRELSVPVSGFKVAKGRDPAPLGPCRLAVPLGALLRQVRGAARDLTFVPGDGMFGAPTLALEAASAETPLRLLPLDVR